MHQSLARYSALVSLVRAPSWADFITAMVGFTHKGRRALRHPNCVHESLGSSYAAKAVSLESLIAPLYLCMCVTVEALEDWCYVDAIGRVLEAFGLAGAAWYPVRDAEAP